jgi:hypothetical protein
MKTHPGTRRREGEAVTPPKLFGREMERDPDACEDEVVWLLDAGTVQVSLYETPASCYDEYKAATYWSGDIYSMTERGGGLFASFGGMGHGPSEVLAVIESWLMTHMLGLTNALGFEVRRVEE